MADEVTGTGTETPRSGEDGRNLQVNPGGDPAREKEFLDSQETRTAEGARASLPQTTLPGSGVIDSIRAADETDTEVTAPGYEAEDAKPGEPSGANVNAEFEDNARGETVTGDPGEPSSEATTPGTETTSTRSRSRS